MIKRKGRWPNVHSYLLTPFTIIIIIELWNWFHFPAQFCTWTNWIWRPYIPLKPLFPPHTQPTVFERMSVKHAQEHVYALFSHKNHTKLKYSKFLFFSFVGETLLYYLHLHAPLLSLRNFFFKNLTTASCPRHQKNVCYLFLFFKLGWKMQIISNSDITVFHVFM